MVIPVGKKKKSSVFPLTDMMPRNMTLTLIMNWTTEQWNQVSEFYHLAVYHMQALCPDGD